MGSSRKNWRTLSLCMIVRDEEKFLPACLESVREVVDQMVIVDTGSTDGTIQVAREHGAEVHEFQWEDDFSKARNCSIKFARCGWIIWLDADERLLPESIPELKKLLKYEKKPVIYTVHIRNLLRDGSNFSLSSAHRLFNNHRGIHFSGRIHEQVSPRAAVLGGEERDSNVFILHFGYGLSAEEADAKNRRNRRLLEKMARDMPRSAYAHYTLAQHYGLTGCLEEALAHYRIAHGLKQFDRAMTASLLNAMAETLEKLGRFEEAKKLSSKSVTMIPLQAAGYFMLYRIALDQGENNCALEWLARLFDNTARLQKSRKRLSTDVLLDPGKILYTMGDLYRRVNKLDEARDCFEKILREHPEHKAVLEQLAEIHIETGNFHKAEECLVRLSGMGGQRERYLDLLGRVLIKQEKFREAIKVYEALLGEQPGERSAMKHLIGLYGKIGEMQKAEALMVASGAGIPGNG